MWIKVGSHCRLNQTDPLIFPLKPDQARLLGVYTTSFRPLDDYRRSIIPTYTRALHDLNRTSARSPPDLHPIRSGCDRILLEYKSRRSGTDLLLDKYTSAHRALLDGLGCSILLDCFWHVKTIRIGSPSDADQARPSRPLAITHTNRARRVPDCLIGLDRVDRFGCGILA